MTACVFSYVLAELRTLYVAVTAVAAGADATSGGQCHAAGLFAGYQCVNRSLAPGALIASGSNTDVICFNMAAVMLLWHCWCLARYCSGFTDSVFGRDCNSRTVRCVLCWLPVWQRQCCVTSGPVCMRAYILLCLDSTLKPALCVRGFHAVRVVCLCCFSVCSMSWTSISDRRGVALLLMLDRLR
jgi:hypothetical protein